eukprot:3337501-Alexandrium_andersonii.AAC.1
MHEFVAVDQSVAASLPWPVGPSSFAQSVLAASRSVAKAVLWLRDLRSKLGLHRCLFCRSWFGQCLKTDVQHGQIFAHRRATRA